MSDEERRAVGIVRAHIERREELQSFILGNISRSNGRTSVSGHYTTEDGLGFSFRAAVDRRLWQLVLFERHQS